MSLPFHAERLPEALRDPRVLEAMRQVPRAPFVPEPYRTAAEEDVALPIGLGQTISQPYVVAYMSAGLAVRPGQRVLEVGTGSGYQTAILAAMEVEVYTIELLPELSARAKETLDALGLGARVHFRVGDGWHGWRDAAPFDGIICTAAPAVLPAELLGQLREGGRLVIPVGPPGEQTLRIMERSGAGFELLHQLPVAFVPLVRADVGA